MSWKHCVSYCSIAGLFANHRKAHYFGIAMKKNRLLFRAKARHRLWVKRYKVYARMRGFKSFNDWPYHRRGFIGCWAAPGFHHFWQIWNPGIAYFVYRAYIRLGGRKHWLSATIASFTACGLVHTLIVAPFFQRWSYTVIVAFACSGILTVLSKRLAPILRQQQWPALFNVLVNVGLVIGSFDLGFRVDRWLG